MSKIKKTDDTASFSMQLENLKIAVQKGQNLEDAVVLADRLLSDSATDYVVIMRLKSLAEYGLGRLEDAYISIRSVLSRSDMQIEDFQLAAEFALQLHLFSDAVNYLSQVILLSQESGDDYYLSTCYLERAYALIELGEKERAKLDIDNLAGNDNAVTWLENIEPITRDSLLARIDSK